MAEFPYKALLQAMLLLSVIFALITVAVFFVRGFRGRDGEDESRISDMITNFEQIHGKGYLSEEEYRTIKTALVQKEAQRLKDKGETD